MPPYPITTSCKEAIMVRPIEELSAEYRRQQGVNPEPVRVVQIDLSFGNIFVLALKFGIVWFVLGVLGALLVRAIV
jgi:hypothetical protein